MRMTSLQERLRIVEMATEGKKDVEIAQELGWKERTVRKWRLKGQSGDRKQCQHGDFLSHELLPSMVCSTPRAIKPVWSAKEFRRFRGRCAGRRRSKR